jgi:hypothetical protein
MRIVLGFVAGLVLGYAATLFCWVGYAELAGVHDRDGGKIMGVAFVLAPAAAIVAGIVGALLARRVRTGP